MKINTTLTILFSSFILPLGMLKGDWVTIADFDTYQVGWGEEEIKNAGWTMQDGDYVGFNECTDGTYDCTAVREITEAPYSPDYGSNTAMMIRAGDPNEALIANSLAHTAIALPQEIPVNGMATVYFRVARENPGGEIFFCLSDLEFENRGPILGDEETIRGYVDNSIIFRMRSGNRDDTFDVYQGGYVPALIDDNDPDYSKVENEVWYDVWLHIDNRALDSGDELGGRYKLYILGGKYGTYGVDEPVHATNTVPAYISAGYEEWFFRRSAGEPLRTFNLLSQYGNPNDNPLGTGATWINTLAMTPGEFVLTRPGEDGGSDWNGYPVNEDGWADTGDWMGSLYVELDPWVYSESIGWFSVGNVEAEGGWVYPIK